MCRIPGGLWRPRLGKGWREIVWKNYGFLILVLIALSPNPLLKLIKVQIYFNSMLTFTTLAKPVGLSSSSPPYKTRLCVSIFIYLVEFLCLAFNVQDFVVCQIIKTGLVKLGVMYSGACILENGFLVFVWIYMDLLNRDD